MIRGLVIIPVLIAAVALANWFMTHGLPHANAMRGWLTLPGSVVSRSATLRTARSTAAPAAVYPRAGGGRGSRRPSTDELLPEAGEPEADFSGVWENKKNSAILRLNQVRSTLAGEYAPAGDMPVVYQFQAKVQDDDTARFDLKKSGALYHMTIAWEDDSLVLSEQKDLGDMLSRYSMHNRLPGGGLIIPPRSPQQRARDRAQLQKMRQEITASVDPVEVGRFERSRK